MDILALHQCVSQAGHGLVESISVYQKAHSQMVVDILKPPFPEVRLKSVNRIPSKAIIVDDVQSNRRVYVFQVDCQTLVARRAQPITEDLHRAPHRREEVVDGLFGEERRNRAASEAVQLMRRGRYCLIVISPQFLRVSMLKAIFTPE